MLLLRFTFTAASASSSSSSSLFFSSSSIPLEAAAHTIFRGGARSLWQVAGTRAHVAFPETFRDRTRRKRKGTREIYDPLSLAYSWTPASKMCPADLGLAFKGLDGEGGGREGRGGGDRDAGCRFVQFAEKQTSKKPDDKEFGKTKVKQKFQVFHCPLHVSV